VLEEGEVDTDAEEPRTQDEGTESDSSVLEPLFSPYPIPIEDTVQAHDPDNNPVYSYNFPEKLKGRRIVSAGKSRVGENAF